MILGRKQVVRGVLQKVKLEIVFLQEVKSSGFELFNHMSYVWNGSFWATDHVQGRGGVVLAISSYLQSFVTSLGSDLSNCCVWITMLFQKRLLCFCFVYAPNLSLVCTHL
jgi:hypothetical protein